MHGSPKPVPSSRRQLAAQWPSLSLGANATRSEGQLTNAASSSGPLYVVGANLSYEADLFGRLARETKAASMGTAEREELLRVAKLLVQADIAQTYFALRALDAERALVRGGAASQLKYRSADRGVAPLRSCVGTRHLCACAPRRKPLQPEALTLDQRRAELEHALAVLIGANPRPHSRSLRPATPIPYRTFRPGIPGAVLVRRPDVGAARRAMIAAQIRSGVAQDRWLPTLSLTAFGGFASSTLGSLFTGAAAASALAALLSLPIFDGGRHLAEVAKRTRTLMPPLRPMASRS